MTSSVTTPSFVTIKQRRRRHELREPGKSFAGRFVRERECVPIITIGYASRGVRRSRLSVSPFRRVGRATFTRRLNRHRAGKHGVIIGPPRTREGQTDHYAVYTCIGAHGPPLLPTVPVARDVKRLTVSSSGRRPKSGCCFFARTSGLVRPRAYTLVPACIQRAHKNTSFILITGGRDKNEIITIFVK